MSLFPPLIVPFLFRRSHWTSRDRKTLPIGKLYDDAKQMPASLRLSEDVINRVFAGRLRALDESFAKTDFLDFFRFDAVLCYMFNPIPRPDELVDRHSPILGEQIRARNACARGIVPLVLTRASCLRGQRSSNGRIAMTASIQLRDIQFHITHT
jgi:hypothetical protein